MIMMMMTEPLLHNLEPYNLTLKLEQAFEMGWLVGNNKVVETAKLVYQERSLSNVLFSSRGNCYFVTIQRNKSLRMD